MASKNEKIAAFFIFISTMMKRKFKNDKLKVIIIPNTKQNN